MQSNAEIECLKRIVALLFALADLADRAVDAPRSMRRTVLGILRPAEAVAREFVMGFQPGFDATGCASEATGMDPAAIRSPSSAILSDGRAETARLASRFRVLALLLAYLLTGMRNPRRARRVFCPETFRAIMGAPRVGSLYGRARGPPRSAKTGQYAPL